MYHPFGLVDIYHDTHNWIIVFDSMTAAIQAQNYTRERRPCIQSNTIELSIASPTMQTTINDPYTHKLPGGAPSQEMAKSLLFNELADMLLKDIKSRILGPCIYDFLAPSLSSIKHSEERELPALDQQSVITAATLESDIVANAINLQASTNTTHKNSRLKTRTISQQSFESSFTPPSKQSYAISMDEKNTHSGHDIMASRFHSTLQQKKSANSVVFKYSSSDDEDDYLGKKPTKKADQKRTAVNHKSKTKEYTSESSDSEEYTKSSKRKASKPSLLSLVKKRKPVQRRPSMSKKQSSSQMLTNKVIEEKHSNLDQRAADSSLVDIDIDGEDLNNAYDDEKAITSKEENKSYAIQQEIDHQELERILESVDDSDVEEDEWNQEEISVELSNEWDPVYQTKDVEDLEYLCVALKEKVDPNEKSTNIGRRLLKGKAREFVY